MGTTTFQAVPVNELFRSLDGYVCRKVSPGQAAYVNCVNPKKDPPFRIGELLPFASYEPVSMDLKVVP